VKPRFFIFPASFEQAPLIRAARRRGPVLAADPDPIAEGAAEADQFEIAGPRDLPRLLELARQFGATAIATDSCDYSVYAAAFLAARLGLPGPSLLAGAVGSNKRLQRERCEAAGIRQPRFRVVRTIEEARAALDAVGLPAIAKPVDNRGAFGITKIESRGDLENAVLDALANAHSREILIEQFIDGEMYTVEGFGFGAQGHRSLTYSWKQMMPGRRRIALELTYPPDRPAAFAARLFAAHDAVAAACGFVTGPTHGEYLVTADDEIYLVEIANRGSGVLISPIAIPQVTGFETCEAILDLAQGRPLSAGFTPTGACVVLSFLVFPEGQVVRFDGREAAALLPGLLSLRIWAREGTVLPPATDALTRHGMILSHGPTRAAAVGAAARARAAVTAVYADGSRCYARSPIDSSAPEVVR